MWWEGALLVLLGIGLLATAGDFLRTSLDVNPKLFSLNFPRLASRFPTVPRVMSWVGVVLGVLLGLTAIICGLILLLF